MHKIVNIYEKFLKSIGCSIKEKFKFFIINLSSNKINNKITKEFKNNFLFALKLNLSSYNPIEKKRIIPKINEENSLVS